jgi:hypothetical protein
VAAVAGTAIGVEEQSYRGGSVELTVASTPPGFVRLVVSASSSLAAAIAASARCRS